MVVPNQLSITSSTLLSGSSGTSYSQALQASGGTPAYTWAVASGNLPSGLSLAATTGVISGTPTSTGTSNFTVSVHDNGSPVQDTASRDLDHCGSSTTNWRRTNLVRPMEMVVRSYSVNNTMGLCLMRYKLPLLRLARLRISTARSMMFGICGPMDPTQRAAPVSICTAPAWGWIGSGGDTYLIDCAGGASCRVGPARLGRTRAIQPWLALVILLEQARLYLFWHCGSLHANFGVNYLACSFGGRKGSHPRRFPALDTY